MIISLLVAAVLGLIPAFIAKKRGVVLDFGGYMGGCFL